MISPIRRVGQVQIRFQAQSQMGVNHGHFVGPLLAQDTGQVEQHFRPSRPDRC